MGRRKKTNLYGYVRKPYQFYGRIEIRCFLEGVKGRGGGTGKGSSWRKKSLLYVSEYFISVKHQNKKHLLFRFKLPLVLTF